RCGRASLAALVAGDEQGRAAARRAGADVRLVRVAHRVLRQRSAARRLALDGGDPPRDEGPDDGRAADLAARAILLTIAGDGRRGAGGARAARGARFLADVLVAGDAAFLPRGADRGAARDTVRTARASARPRGVASGAGTCSARRRAPRAGIE